MTQFVTPPTQFAAGTEVSRNELCSRVERLEIRCTRCDRAGRMKLDKLVAQHGPDLPMPELAVRLAADCPKATATNPADRCFAKHRPSRSWWSWRA